MVPSTGTVRLRCLIGVGMDQDRALELLQLAERAEPHVYGPDQRAWRARLNEAADEISQALGFFLDQGNGDAALRLAGALRLFWMDTGRVDQGRGWLGAALDAHDGSPSLARARALVAAGELAFRQGDQAAARSWTTQSLEHAQLLGHPSTVALAHTNLARIALRDGDAGAIERHAQLGSRRRGRICTRAAGRCTCSPGPLTPLATWRGPGRCSWTAWSFVGGWATGWGRRSS